MGISVELLLIVFLVLIAVGLVAYTFLSTTLLERNSDNKKIDAKGKAKSKVKATEDEEEIDPLKAIVKVKSKEIKIDGVGLDECEVNIDADIDNTDSFDIKLLPGEHLFDGFFSVTGVNNCNVVNYKTNRVRSKIELDAGCKYSLGLYLYSAEDRRKFYSNEELSEIYEQEVNVNGYNQKVYIICYKES